MFKYIDGVIIVALSTAFLWHLSNIIRYGSHWIQEPNLVVLVVEIILIGLLFLYGLFRLVNTLMAGNG